MKIIDISPLISSEIAVWPGDQKFSQNINLSIDKGSNIDLSSILTTLHLGAHADSRSHYQKNGKTIDQMDLKPYLGKCQVIEVNILRSERIKPEHIKVKIEAPRVLFKTNSFPNPNIFNEDFNSLSDELIQHLAENKCLLVGIDTPSVDPFDDKLLEAHHSLIKNNIYNLEGLVLSNVNPGLYNLIALPLKIKGADASPVRAVLTEN